MANLKELRDRLSGVQSTRKITRAMQMVAAAKLRRAQDAAEQARPYADRMLEMIAGLNDALPRSQAPELMVGSGKRQKQMMAVVTSERGLCGSFNSAVIRLVRRHVEAHRKAGREISFLCIGKKGREALRRFYPSATLEEPPLAGDLAADRPTTFQTAAAAASCALKWREEGRFDECTLFYSRFKSAMTQEPTAQALVPLDPQRDEGDPELNDVEIAPRSDLGAAAYDYEPEEDILLESLLRANVAAQLQRALLESAAGEQGARMVAMDNATRNAGDMIDRISLLYNRTRQAMITRELVEIISGAEAL